MSYVKMVMWSLAIGLLVGAGWLVCMHQPQAEKTLADAASALTGAWSPLARNFSIDQFGAIGQPTTVLFMGTDVVYQDASRRQADTGSCRGNSDTMMLVFLNPEYKTMSVLNIPRDTEAYVGGSIRKINSANAIGGPDLARSTVSSLLGVSADHFVVMNIRGLVEMVNELGGITVEVPKRMNYMDWTGKLKIDLEPGFHTLTGNQSMGFVRFRHDALGDIGRIQRQQIFLQAATRKMLNPASWVHLNALLAIAQRNIETDMSPVDIVKTLAFMHSVRKDSIKFVMLPGQFAGNGDWLANTDGRALAQRLANPGEETLTSRRNITVCVINATSDPTLGGRVARALHALGYVTCVGQDQKDPVSGKTRIIAQTGNVSDARMMQQDLGNVGEIVNSSVGNLTTALTVVAHDDVRLDQIRMSSADLPYVEHTTAPQPLVVLPPHLSVPNVEQGKMAVPDAAEVPFASGQADTSDSTMTTGDDDTQPDYSTTPWAGDAAQAEPASEPMPETGPGQSLMNPDSLWLEGRKKP